MSNTEAVTVKGISVCSWHLAALHLYTLLHINSSETTEQQHVLLRCGQVLEVTVANSIKIKTHIQDFFKKKLQLCLDVAEQ